VSGVAITTVQSNGVTTTFATILDLRCQPGKSMDIQVGYFVDEPSFTNGLDPVYKEYWSLDITQINMAGNIPAQIISQLTAAGAICDGGTPVS
jgi:hypothetical protein